MATARPSIATDVFYLKDRLRWEDVREVEATGSSPLLALHAGLRGTECLTMIDGDVPIGMFGINHLPEFGPDQACVWLLATPELVTIKRDFMRETATWLSRFHEKFPLLWNLVDSRNETHVRWLRGFGFHFLRVVPVGISQVPFYEFVRLP